MTQHATMVMIGNALETGAATLRRSFDCASRDFWPASGDSDVAERHLTHHLANAFAAKGYQPYFEVARKGQRLDLVLVKWRNRKAAHVIAVEAKLLYSSNGRAGALARDVRKLAKWKPRGNTACIGGNVPVHRIVIASMWSDKTSNRKLGRERMALVKAWRSADALERKFTTKGWRALARSARKRGASFLQCDAAWWQPWQQHLLAVVW